MNYKDIPQLTKSGSYRINVGWDYLKKHLENWCERDLSLASLDLDPDFQRGHVWTESQQIAYVEYKLRGGAGSNELQFNCAGWMKDFRGPFVIVDGKQRLAAVLAFLDGKIKAFGHFVHEFEGWPRADFVFVVNDLRTRKDVLQWYLELNSGGTPHSKAEIERVKTLLANEVSL